MAILTGRKPTLAVVDPSYGGHAVETTIVLIRAPLTAILATISVTFGAGNQHCVVNDLSERAFQLEHGGQWVKGKSCDTFGPIGPWLVTRDEIEDPQKLSLWLEVDGHRYQNGNTGTMIFPVEEILSYISRFMTLQPGDIVSTGTPPGVGLGQKPNPVYLDAGQRMRLGIDGLGEQEQLTVACV